MISKWVRRSIFAFPAAVIGSWAATPMQLNVTPAYWGFFATAMIGSLAVAWVAYRLLEKKLWTEAALANVVLVPFMAHALLVDFDMAVGLPLMQRGVFSSSHWLDFLLTVAIGSLVAGGAIGLGRLLRRRIG